jgi:hypothetical protein
MSKLNKARILATLAAAIVCAPAMAVDYSCDGPLTGVTVSPGDSLGRNRGRPELGLFLPTGHHHQRYRSRGLQGVYWGPTLLS